jgi:23S rRNA (uracil1939-C5)-methyltransferase
VKVGDQITVEIEKLTFGGAGLAHFEGRVVFVPFSAPQDQIKIEITELKKNFLKANIVEILKASPFRTKPPCKLYGKCGGCNWQHISYEYQLLAKQEIVQEIWTRKLSGDASTIQPIIASPSSWNYRNRIQVKSLAQSTGFFAKNSHDIVQMDSCYIADEKINTEYAAWKKSKKNDTELTRYNFKLTAKSQVAITPIGSDDEPLGFSQVNSAQNERLINLVLEAYTQFPKSKVFDLYGGPCNFSLPLAKKYSDISLECVESNAKACDAGSKLAAAHNLKNIQIIQGDVAKFLRRISTLEKSMVIIDPPREGCDDQVINYLLKLQPELIIYISCDPMTWARDVKKLMTNYRAAKIQPLDMFPQTDHIEIFSVWQNSKLC